MNNLEKEDLFVVPYHEHVRRELARTNISCARICRYARVENSGIYKALRGEGQISYEMAVKLMHAIGKMRIGDSIAAECGFQEAEEFAGRTAC